MSGTPAALVDVALREGLTQRGHAAWGPCPVCGADRRGRDDRRGPLHLTGELWKCHAGGCGVGGGAAALLSAVRFGEVLPKGDPRWREVFVEQEAPSAPRRSRQRSNDTQYYDSGPSTYPPEDEISSLWDVCTPLDRLPSGDPALATLAARPLNVGLLGQLDLVRVLPPLSSRPRWLPAEAPELYRLVVPVYDATGALRSLRFRAVRAPGNAPNGKPRPKAYPPWGFGLGGLVMAEWMARALLRGQREDDGMRWDGRIVVCEGEPDWWTWAARETRMHQARTTGATYAVFGIVSGSWSPAIAARVPDGATVIVRTDQNPAGDRYAETIRASLAGRCLVKRPPRAAYGAP